MNECMVLPSPGCGVISAGEALALGPAVLASHKAQEQLTKPADSLMRAVFAALENIILITIEKRTPQEFEATRLQVFRPYYDAVLALPPIMKVVLSSGSLDLLVRESLCEAEAEIRDSRAERFFGSPVRDQAMFALWTLRKINDLANQIPSAPPPMLSKEATAKVDDLLLKFSWSGVWARFHLQCLFVSLRVSKPIFPTVLESILMGLRAEVNAYAHIRQAVDILAPRVLPDDPPQVWDEEDASLLAASVSDMIPEEV